MGTTAFLPSPNNVGEEYVTLTPGAIGGANRLLGATPLTSAGVTNIPLPVSGLDVAFKKASVLLAGTVPAGTGNLYASIRKRDASGTFTTISTTVDLFGRTQWDHVPLTPVAGTSLRQRSRFANVAAGPGESFVLTIDNSNGTITTQPVDLLPTVVGCVLR